MSRRATGSPARILIASNRGPVTFEREGAEIVPRRGGGGLVTALAGAVRSRGGLWIASAMSKEDQRVARHGAVDVAADGVETSVRYLPFDFDTYDAYYNGISNRVLWFAHHYLWDIPRSPRFGNRTREDWAAYRSVNRAFADALVEGAAGLGGDVVHLVQDYHLSLVPRMVRIRLPEARISHFSHIPFAGSTYIRIMPSWMVDELLAGLLGADVVGFQADRWADNFLLACRTLSGTRVNLRRRLVLWEGREVRVRVYPVAVGRAELEDAATGGAFDRAVARLERWRGDTRLVVRADRAELSKNVIRGFQAFEELLMRYRQWRRRVRMLAFLDPSREDVPEYRRYTRECLTLAERINERFGDADWKPIVTRVGAERTSLLAAYRLYDVLLVNPVYDGMNLVAKEGPVLNRRGGVLVLSRNAGAFAELGRHALAVDPFDVGETADQLSLALQMPEEERARRARGLRSAVLRRTPERWIGSQVEDLTGPGPR